MTVGLSVLAHGATAAPLATRYASWLEARGETPVESGAEHELRWRLQREQT